MRILRTFAFLAVTLQVTAAGEPAFIPVVHEGSSLTLEGNAFEVASLKEGEKVFIDRKGVWKQVPESLKGFRFTRLASGMASLVRVTAKKAATVMIAVTAGPELKLPGWTEVAEKLDCKDCDQAAAMIYRRTLGRGETIDLPAVAAGFAGLLFSEP